MPYIPCPEGRHEPHFTGKNVVDPCPDCQREMKKAITHTTAANNVTVTAASDPTGFLCQHCKNTRKDGYMLLADSVCTFEYTCVACAKSGKL